MQCTRPNNHRHTHHHHSHFRHIQRHLMIARRKYPTPNMRTCMGNKQVYLLSLFMALLRKREKSVIRWFGVVGNRNGGGSMSGPSSPPHQQHIQECNAHDWDIKSDAKQVADLRTALFLGSNWNESQDMMPPCLSAAGKNRAMRPSKRSSSRSFARSGSERAVARSSNPFSCWMKTWPS